MLLLCSLGAVDSTTPEVPDVTDDVFTGVGITPARIEADLTAREADLEVVVFNDAGAERTVTIEVAELGHTLDGSPQYGAAPSTISATGTGTFVMQPGDVRDVALGIAFPDEVAEYVAVTATVAPLDEGQTVTTRTQVAALFLLRGPRPWDQSLGVGEIGLDYADGGVEASLYADVTNVGNAHVRPSGRFVVTQDGEQMAVVALPGENILPGFARRLRSAWVPSSDASGPIEIELQLEDGPGGAGSADLADIPGRIAEERSDQGMPPVGATLEVVDAAPPAELTVAALILLITAMLLLLIAWWKRRDEEEDDEHEAEEATAGVGDDSG